MMLNTRLIGILLAVVFVLLIPFVAMQFTDDVRWNAVDFVVAGVLLLGTGFLIELSIRLVKNIGYRIVLCGALLVALFLVWAELAVGIFGTPLTGS